MFRQYLYSDELPTIPHAKQLMCLAFLFDVVGFDDHATRCLRQLSMHKVPQATAVTELMELYCYAQDLQPFKRGEKVAVRLMRENRDVLVPHTHDFPKLLGKHSHKVMDLVASLIASADGPLEEATQDRAGKGALPLDETLCRMHESRNKDGDFEIVLSGCEPRKVHSIVLYSVWPYFRRMIDSGMKEKKARRLALPCAGEDGGMSEEVLDLTIELAYTRKMTADLIYRYFSAHVTLQI
eukprot:TRINITY_DN4288_c0_g1_i1.p1 TRINITY_DN4288_c0_g1~~TRINITY_DN4288_c0_g1_i1.p1  ORF type:complete len:239 (-),score=26.39 TRINITY_DN4288_c0_g1_i1:31-747(-)